jgi:MFS family permease
VNALPVLGAVWRNPELRRVELAFAAFNGAEWAVWIAMLVYAYDQGGATTAGLVALAQLVPAGLFAPVAAARADRMRAGRVLALGYVAQATAMAATGAVLLLSGPPLLAYALAAVAATAVTITRPAQAALLPSLARTPDELTATNVVSGWIESVSMLAAPAAAGVLLGVGGPGWVFVAMAALAALGGLAVAPIAGPPPAGDPEAPAEPAWRLAVEVPQVRLLVGLLGAQYVAIGALDVLYVVLAVSVLDLGGSGAGYLNAAFGAGGVAAIAATATLVGRAKLAPALAAALAVWCVAFAVLAARPTTLGVFLLLGLAGAARSTYDVTGRTLLQRTAAPHVLARVFGLLEGLSMAGLALGSLLAPALVGLGGTRAALAGLALLPVLALLARHGLAVADREASVPVVQTGLLRALPMFAPLPGPRLERVARSLEPVTAAAGEVVIRQGDVGDRFYVVASGEVEARYDDTVVSTLGRGEGFGEIALLRDVPRTVTIVSRTDVSLYALERDDFLDALTGSARARHEAERLADARLAVAPGTDVGARIGA